MKIHYAKQKAGACSGKKEAKHIKDVTCSNCLRNVVDNTVDHHWQTRLTARTNLSYHYPTAYRNWFGS